MDVSQIGCRWINLFGFSFAVFPVAFCLFSHPCLPLALCFLYQSYCRSFLVFHEQNGQFGKSKPCDNFSIAWRKALSRENSKARRVKILWLHRRGKLRAGSLQNASLSLHSLMQDRSAVLFLLMSHYFGLRSLVTVGPDHIIVCCTRNCTACSGVH